MLRFWCCGDRSICNCLLGFSFQSKVDGEDADRYHGGGEDEQYREPFTSARVGRGIDLGFVENDERSLIKVATFVGFRIDEEALGATFHLFRI